MTSRQSFDMLGRRLNGKELPSEDNSDDDSINESDSNTNLTPSLLTLQNQQSLAPPKLTISTLQPNVPQSEIQHHRHLLRTRSSNGATAHASGGTSGKRDEYEAGENGGNGSGSRRIAVGNEFMLAELPSPILTTPNQGLSGLSEKLTHLQSRASSQASSRKNSSSGPINGEHQDAENSTSFSTNDILHSPAAAVALIAQASKTGSRFGGEVKDNRSSITQPPSRRRSSSIESVQMEKSLSTGDPTLNAIASKNNQVNRRNDPISSVGPSTASASHTGTPNVSGTSTPAMKNHSMRLKPNVLETSHLHLQTHTPSGRRMINQYVIEDELGRGVHGKVRLARDTETGERVAVKIVEREGKKKLGQNSNLWNKRISINSTNTKGKEVEGNISSETDPVKIPQEGSVDSSNQRQPIARFAASPPHSPGNTLSRYQAAQIAARYGRWGEGAPNRPTYGDLEMEKQREKERKRLLWTTDQKVKREIAIMKKCSHDNVVRLKEVIDDPHSKKVFMILEYMEGGEVVWKDERGFPTLTVDEARRTFRDVVLGLEYLHYQGIIHRDIKPANLLLDKNYKVKISDFGVSHFSYALLVSSGGLPSFDNDEERQKDPSLADDRELAKTAGSPAFFAPELCLAGEPILTTSSSKAGVESDGEQPIQKPSSRPPITKAIDIWALGVTLYCLLFGHVPFTADNEFALFSVITKEDFELPAYMGADRIRIGPRAKRWVNLKPWTDEEGDVDEDHMRGPKEPDVDVNSLNDEALMVRDLLGKLLEKDPMKRIKLEDVKKHPWLTQGLADPPQWLSETDPSHIPLVQVTREDVETALTGFSKIKQTLKKLQHKFFSGLTGHGYDREIEIQKALPGNMEHKERVQRRRSKSASQASNDVPSFVTNSSKTSPKNAISNAKMLPPGNHSPQMVQNETLRPNSASSRPHFFFSRRKSVALDGNKQGLTVKKRHSQLRPGNSVSQPGSRSHSPNQLEMEEEEGFIKIETEGRSSRISPQRRSSRRYDETVLPMSSLEPIISGQEAGAGAGNTLHSTLAGQEQALRTRKSGNDKMRPASRGSLRVLESYNVFHNQSNKIGTDSSSIASHDRDLSGLQNRTFSGSTTSSSIGGPSRPRSRSRLGDVFRNVWTHGNNEGNSIKQSRFRSRPVTSASSAAVSPVLDKGVKMLQDQQRTASENNVLQRNQTNHQNNDKTPTMKSISKMTPTKSIEQLDSISQAHLNNPPKIIGVDDIDTDLDLSDEDSDENHQVYGGDEEHVWRGTSAGWSIGKINPQDGITNSDSVEDTKENRERDSFTPSVEGGYNVFKPPFQGKFVLDTSSGDKGNDSMESNSYSEDQQQKLKRQNKQQIVNKSSHVPGPDVSPGDLTIMSEDRFADAEEATYDHHEQQQQQQDQQQISHLVQPVSTSNHIVQNIVSPTAAFMQRGGSTISSSQASDSISGADEDEGGVSFQTKRRLGR